MELTDEQLEKVTGGGSGNIPAGGITYKTYTKAHSNHYYAQAIGDTDLMYILVDGSANYFTETLIVDKQNNTWSTVRTSNVLPAPPNFSTTYPYQLNIQP